MARKIAIDIFLMLVAGIVLALIGPFGSYELPLAQRLILWPLMILCGYPIFGGLGAVARWLAEAVDIPYAVTITIGLAVGALPMTLLVLLLWRRAPLEQALASPMLGPLYLQVLVIGVIIHSAMHLLFRPPAEPPSAPPVAEPPSLPPTLLPPASPAPAPPSEPAAGLPAAAALPLPPDFGPVRALKGEDHYVRVIGARSDELVLMRMRDAIERLGDADGLRVHRSWWVARDAVVALRRDGRSAVIDLAGGHQVRVARDMMPQLRAAGWL